MNNKTVLVVDDEASIRDTISQILKIKGYTVVCAENGLDAFEIVKKQSISLVISDIRMPKCDGAKLLELIKSYDRKIPVVLVTGYSDFRAEDLIKKGASSLLFKPFPMKELISVVEQFIPKI